MTDDELRQEFENLKTYLLEFRTEVIRQFEDVNRRLDTLNGTLSSMDARLPVLTKSVTHLESRVYGPPSQESKIAELEARIRKLEGAA